MHDELGLPAAQLRFELREPGAGATRVEHREDLPFRNLGPVAGRPFDHLPGDPTAHRHHVGGDARVGLAHEHHRPAQPLRAP